MVMVRCGSASALGAWMRGGGRRFVGADTSAVLLLAAVLGSGLGGGPFGASAFAQTTNFPAPPNGTLSRSQGIDFVTIGQPGNAPWAGNGTLGDRAIGRGRVDYEYRIGRFEVTTAQWVEFMNAAYDRPANDQIPFMQLPGVWGAVGTEPTVTNARRWSVPAGNEMRPVGNISWRMAAIYCNWLHNDKSLSRDAFLTGAYNVGTFGYTGPNGDQFTDQAARSPGARYFIPTWDEWLKATHFDPNRFGQGQPGWWSFANMRETVTPIGLPPPFGTGEANAGSGSAGIPLGSYVNIMSPWGLYDTAGGMKEWTESIFFSTTLDNGRIFDGSAYDTSTISDIISFREAEFPSFALGNYGFRIAAAIPSPNTGIALGALFFIALRRRRVTP
ncbi:MAG: SUMF1/EgtB/PvdO family nonheme iron enzyme [Pseudomonadota bacterium]